MKKFVPCGVSTDCLLLELFALVFWTLAFKMRLQEENQGVLEVVKSTAVPPGVKLETLSSGKLLAFGIAKGDCSPHWAANAWVVGLKFSLKYPRDFEI